MGKFFRQSVWLGSLPAGLASLLLLGCALTAVRTWLATHDVQAAQAASAPAEELLRQARQLRPDLSDAWRESARQDSFLNRRQALAYIRTAIQLEPANWKNWQMYSLIALQTEQQSVALQALQRASHLNAGFSAHYQLANLAWMVGDEGTFWSEMKKALAMAPPPQIGPTLQQVEHLAGDQPERLLALTPPARVDVAFQVQAQLLAHGHLAIAQRYWQGLECAPDQQPACRESALAMVEAWLQAGSVTRGGDLPASSTPGAAAQAMRDWNVAVSKGWLTANPENWGSIADGQFEKPWLGGFAWHAESREVSLVSASPPVAGNVASISFDGSESSAVPLLSTWVAVQPGHNYQIAYYARGDLLAAENSGMSLTISLPNGTVLWSLPADLTSQWRRYEGRVAIPAPADLLRIALQYQRPLGHDLLRAQVHIGQISMQESR